MTVTLEAELVDLAISGNIDSFGRLCEKYYNPLAAIAYSVLSDHHLAEDAAQETFARALKNLKKLKSKEKFGPWLVRICRNVAKDMAKAKPKNLNTDNFLPVTDNSRENCENHAVKQAISSLPLLERELIILRYYNNMSHEQMSSVLGLSKVAINNRLVRTRRKIAEYLKNNGFIEVQL